VGWVFPLFSVSTGSSRPSPRRMAGCPAPSRLSLQRRRRAERPLRARGLSLRGAELLPPRCRGLHPSQSPGHRRQTSRKCFIQVIASRKPKRSLTVDQKKTPKNQTPIFSRRGCPAPTSGPAAAIVRGTARRGEQPGVPPPCCPASLCPLEQQSDLDLKITIKKKKTKKKTPKKGEGKK